MKKLITYRVTCDDEFIRLVRAESRMQAFDRIKKETFGQSLTGVHLQEIDPVQYLRRSIEFGYDTTQKLVDHTHLTGEEIRSLLQASVKHKEVSNEDWTWVLH